MMRKSGASHPGSDGPIVESLYWRRTRTWTAALLLAWLAITLLATLAPGLWPFSVRGWPFHFWFGAQGALLLFLGIVFAYARQMDRLDAEAQAQAQAPKPDADPDPNPPSPPAP